MREHFFGQEWPKGSAGYGYKPLKTLFLKNREMRNQWRYKKWMKPGIIWKEWWKSINIWPTKLAWWNLSRNHLITVLISPCRTSTSLDGNAHHRKCRSGKYPSACYPFGKCRHATIKKVSVEKQNTRLLFSLPNWGYRLRRAKVTVP